MYFLRGGGKVISGIALLSCTKELRSPVCQPAPIEPPIRFFFYRVSRFPGLFSRARAFTVQLEIRPDTRFKILLSFYTGKQMVIKLINKLSLYLRLIQWKYTSSLLLTVYKRSLHHHRVFKLQIHPESSDSCHKKMLLESQTIPLRSFVIDLTQRLSNYDFPTI